MQKSHILVLDSRDRLNYGVSNSNDCRLTIQPAVTGFNKVELLSFSLPLTSYQINATNNLIYFDVDGTDYTATITPSAYTICTLTAELKRVMDLASGLAFDIWYDSGLFRLVFNLPASGDISFNWGTFQTNSAANILGFNLSDVSPSTTIISTNAINLSLPMYFYVSIIQLGIHARTTHEHDYATFVICSTGNSGDINQFNMFATYQLLENCPSNTLQTIDVQIKERGNQLVDLNNSDWTIVLRLHYPDSTTGV